MDRGKLRSVSFDWLKKGNSRMPRWDNTILGSIKVSVGSLHAEVNSEKRAKRLRNEIEKRLGANATHLRTVAQTADEMFAKLPKRNSARAKVDEEIVDDILRDPEIRKTISGKNPEASRGLGLSEDSNSRWPDTDASGSRSRRERNR
jgi:hypothetical protein